MRVVVLGAGASKAYVESPTGLEMPLAREVLETFERVPLSRDPLVLSHSVILYLKQTRGIPFEVFLRSGEDIEDFHSEVLEASVRSVTEGDKVAQVMNYSAYIQLTFLLAFTINQIQSGPISPAHVNLAHHLRSDDVILTFNWDTLMERALAATGRWTPDSGYGVAPRQLYSDAWRTPVPVRSTAPTLLKLHGSTNWLTSYLTLDEGVLSHTQSSDPSTLYVFEAASKPYDTYQGRYMAGYEPYSYGYYPPNLPERGKAAPPGMSIVRMTPKYPWIPPATSGDSSLVSIPLMIPPVKRKSYDMFGALFAKLWQDAHEALSQAEKVILVGYSFPRTDQESRNLFRKALLSHRASREIVLLNPDAERLAGVFERECDVPRSRITSLTG